MKLIENELETADVYVAPTLQVTDVIIEENVLANGSGVLKGFGGDNW